jgi:3-dehydroquinate dehydratase-2
MDILVINGANMNMLGLRDQSLYGTETLDSINRRIADEAAKLGVEVDFFQSNHEGEIIDKLQEANITFKGVMINPGAFTHYSYAIFEAIEAISIPVIEVHLSNSNGKLDFRQKSVTAPACWGVIEGFRYRSYLLALYAFVDLLKEQGKI